MNSEKWEKASVSPLEHLSMSSEDWSQAATLAWLVELPGNAPAGCTEDCLRTDTHCRSRQTQSSARKTIWRFQLVKWNISEPGGSTEALQRPLQFYPSDRCTLSYAGGEGGGIEGVKEGLLVGTSDDLVLPMDPMVAQLCHPLVKQLRWLYLWRNEHKGRWDMEGGKNYLHFFF